MARLRVWWWFVQGGPRGRDEPTSNVCLCVPGVTAVVAVTVTVAAAVVVVVAARPAEVRGQGEKVAISREIRCHSSLVCLPRFRFCSTSLNCIMPTGVRQKAPRALRMMFTKSS